MVAWHDDGDYVRVSATIVVNNADLGTLYVSDRSSDGGPCNLQISSAEFPCIVAACVSISALLPSLLILLTQEGLTAGEHVEEECERPLLMSRLHAAHL